MGAIKVTRKPCIVVVSGPSGVGKSTIVDRVIGEADGMKRSISMTSRVPRRGEKNGVEYHFVTREEFFEARDAGELLEWAEVHGNLYGTPADYVERVLGEGADVILEIDVQGGMKVREKKPDAVLVFLLPPSFGELERRLRSRRTDDEATIAHRLKNAREELKYFERYEYLVVNDDIDRCARDVLSLIRGESLRRDRTTVNITY